MFLYGVSPFSFLFPLFFVVVVEFVVFFSRFIIVIIIIWYEVVTLCWRFYLQLSFINGFYLHILSFDEL